MKFSFPDKRCNPHALNPEGKKPDVGLTVWHGC